MEVWDVNPEELKVTRICSALVVGLPVDEHTDLFLSQQTGVLTDPRFTTHVIDLRTGARIATIEGKNLQGAETLPPLILPANSIAMDSKVNILYIVLVGFIALLLLIVRLRAKKATHEESNLGEKVDP